MITMNDTTRACQFLPFNGLRGFEELIRQAETKKTKRREITEDQAQELNDTLCHLQRGDPVRMIYYTKAGYVTKECTILEINPYLHYLRTPLGCLPFRDIWEIEKV